MFILIDKPKGITSHDVVDMVRKITGERKVGHAGTLDPNATGLLVVGVGRESTKKLGSIAKGTNKVYEAEIIMGEERDTGDVEGKIVFKYEGAEYPTLSAVKKVLKSFEGKIKQTPPSFSAIKIDGKKAYELARQGVEVKMPEREVVINKIELLKYQYPDLKITTDVSAGTYIRSLAQDIGRKLAVGAYLANLRRTAVGDISVNQAANPQVLKPSNWEEFAVTI